jgi:hypothetical protein
VSRFERLLLHLSIALSAWSGIVYWIMRDVLRRTDPYSVLGHPWQPHVLALHVLVGPFVVFALGLIAREHIVGRVRNGASIAGRRSGVIAILLAAPMILTGYLVQVVTSPSGRPLLGWTHLASGLAFTLLFGAHLWRTARRRLPRSTTLAGAADRRPS